MYVEFRSEKKAMSFMTYLMEQNNQGHRQVLYTPVGKKGVEYEFHDVIHEDVYDRIERYLNKVAHEKIA